MPETNNLNQTLWGKESRLARGKPVGYLLKRSGGFEFQLVFRAGGDQHLAFNLLQVHRSNRSITPLAPLVKIKAFFSYNEARLKHL